MRTSGQERRDGPTGEGQASGGDRRGQRRWWRMSHGTCGRMQADVRTEGSEDGNRAGGKDGVDKRRWEGQVGHRGTWITTLA